MSKPKNRREALQAHGGPIERGGEEALSAKLSAAFERAETDPADELTHGFHSYPARMHPAIARAVIPAFCLPGGRVVDPFCGSGTVPIEA